MENKKYDPQFESLKAFWDAQQERLSLLSGMTITDHVMNLSAAFGETEIMMFEKLMQTQKQLAEMASQVPVAPAVVSSSRRIPNPVIDGLDLFNPKTVRRFEIHPYENNAVVRGESMIPSTGILLLLGKSDAYAKAFVDFFGAKGLTVKQVDDLGEAMKTLLSDLKNRSEMTGTAVLIAGSFDSLCRMNLVKQLNCLSFCDIMKQRIAYWMVWSMNYKITLYSNNGPVKFFDDTVHFTAEKESDDTRFAFSVEFPEWEDTAYIFLPACVYDGNKLKRIRFAYPPMYREEDCGVNPLPIISDVPAFNEDGSGSIEITSGDLSVPCYGIFFKRKQQAFFVFTEQSCKGKNIGFRAEQGSITVQFPVIRSKSYRMCRTDKLSSDSGISVKKGEQICVKLRIKEFACKDIPEFFELFFENRRCLLSDRPRPNGYTQELWHLMEEHMNRDNFSGEYYAETSKKWQCGWVGGGMSSLPLLKHGSELSKLRAIQTIDFMTSNISPAGFFYGMIEDGVISDDGFGNEHMKHSLLVRKNGDALYFLFKHFSVISPKPSWISAAKNCADAFVKLYERYHDFGHFIHIETGDMLFGGTASGASAVSALVCAWQYLGNVKYLDIARSAGEKYYVDYVERGVTYGGPGEALCAPDSESAYAILESMVLLYEATKEQKWLTYAKHSLHLLSSWIMPYSYVFPMDSELGRLRVNTVGSVFANVQNKHSAPGFCTASGDAIYKLYKYTGNRKYLELLRDVVFCIPQCVSTESRPIFSWDKAPRKLLPGWINERINTSDWEGEQRVGEVFYGSCWCETALLLTFSEIIRNPEIRQSLESEI